MYFRMVVTELHLKHKYTALHWVCTTKHTQHSSLSHCSGVFFLFKLMTAILKYTIHKRVSLVPQITSNSWFFLFFFLDCRFIFPSIFIVYQTIDVLFVGKAAFIQEKLGVRGKGISMCVALNCSQKITETHPFAGH